MTVTVLITGANRGLGKGLLERYLLLPNHTIIAANRKPSDPTSKELSTFPRAPGTKLVLVKLDARIWSDASEAIKSLQNQGIEHLDVVIANAGICASNPRVVDVKQEELIAHMEANAYGVVSLYQAVQPLLQKSGREPVFVVMGTTASSLNSQPPIFNGVYGPSKAAAAWYSVRINEEDSWLNSFSLGPGWVHTDLGDAGAENLGVTREMREAMMIGLEESCDGMMRVLGETSKEKHGGKLVIYSGEVGDF